VPSSPAVVRLVATGIVQPQPERNRVEVDVALRAELDDGRVVDVRHHGFAIAAMNAGDVTGIVPPVDEVDVRNVLIPDDDDDPEPLPWAVHVEDLREQGVEATVEALKAVPYDVVLREQGADAG
jgi:hypothetical protein